MIEFSPDLLRAIAARPADTLIGRRAGAPVRQDEFLQRVGAWQALAQRTPGRHVALYLNDSIEFAAALLGLWQGGKTVWLSGDTLGASCAALAASVDAFLGEFPSLWAAQVPAADDVPPGAPPASLDADFAALVVHTSGSTGAALAIPKRWSQLAAEVATLEAMFGARLGQAEIIATVSHQHIYGLLFKVLWPLAGARPIHAHSMNFPEQLAQALALRPCVLVASPAHLKRLPDHLAWQAVPPHLRAVFSSGGPLSPDVALATGARLGRVPIEVYGSSETGGIAWRQQRPGAPGAWQALTDVEWRVADESLLEVRSRRLGADGWLRLADRVQATADQRFMLLGRSDRIVKIEEKRISLDAIEAALLSSALVAQARVIVAQEEAGQRQKLAAFIVPAQPGRALLQAHGKLALNRQLRTLLDGVVEAVALPRHWRYLDDMPVNAQGKTTYAQLLGLLENASTRRPTLPHMRPLERAAGRVLLELSVPPTLLYFGGHFPAAPVLPGVVQVDWAIHYGREHFALPSVFRAIHALKFQRVIQPGPPVVLELLYDENKASLNFRYFSDAGPHASGRILFGP